MSGEQNSSGACREVPGGVVAVGVAGQEASMRLWFEALRVVLQGIVRGPAKVLSPKRWLAGDVIIIRDRRPEPSPSPPSDSSAVLRVIIGAAWARRGVRLLCAMLWVPTNAPAPPATAERLTSGDSRGKAGEAWASRLPSLPLFVFRGVLLRVGIGPSSYNRGARACLLARRDEVADLWVRVDQVERRLDAIEKTRVAAQVVEG